MLKVYNTLTGQKEEFKPVKPGKIKMYVCGLTVQNYSHLGHIRSAINYDVIRRYLEYKGYDVYFIQNFTDINEKIIDRAREEGVTPRVLAKKYTDAYLEDIDALNIKRADSYCTATENIEEIQAMVQTLIDKGYAYEVNGNVYFSVNKFEDYGKLSGRDLSEMEAGSRVEVNEEKRNPMDFALWKKVEGNAVSWDSPWGEGWPGWHIECSAMSLNQLGASFDIHGGGTDLIFPHHENEIAQSEACSGQKPFVKYWLHNGTVDIKGEKMSKSLGNFFTTRELLQKFNPDEIRYFLLTKHYRSPIDFSLEALESSRVSLKRLINTKKNIENILAKGVEKNPLNEFNADNFDKRLVKRRQEFIDAMDNDFNSARAIGVLHELARDINTLINNFDFKLNQKTKKLVTNAESLFNEILSILGLTLIEGNVEHKQFHLFDDVVEYILDLRQQARQEKNWKFADKIRDDLDKMGIKIKDTSHGYEWEIKKEGE